MMQSRINPEIKYKEKKEIYAEDKGHVYDVFETSFFDTDVRITLGKIKYTFSGKGVIYFPIYLVKNKKVTDQIGVYELPANETLELYDEDGNIDLDLLDEELLFSFAADLILGESHTINTVSDDQVPMSNKDKDKEDDTQATEQTTTKNDTSIQLLEETKEEADDIVRNYKTKTNDQNWLQKFFHNPYYRIHSEDIETNGDCFFATLREAFKQIGKPTTVAQLRQLLSENLTEDHYLYYKRTQDLMESEIKNCDQKLKEIKKLLEGEKKRKLKSTNLSKQEHTKLVEECRQLEIQYKEIANDKLETIQTMHNLLGNNATNAFRSMDSFREHVLKSAFWADEFTILTLERLLKIKLIILHESRYHDRSQHHVLECGYYDDGEVVQPEHYILATYQGDHYVVVSYKNKKIFTFRELPYTIKDLIVMKCLEQNAGVFPYIKEFKQFQEQTSTAAELSDRMTSLNIPPASTPTIDVNVDADTVFMFYSKSANKVKPGKGAGEKLSLNRIQDFKDLGKIDSWRRKLDDTWMDLEDPIEVDAKKYASIVHYVEGAKYKKQFPDFAKQFSLNSDSEFSKSVELCKTAVKPNVYEDEPPVTPDPDFASRKDKERETALLAKFRKPEFQRILLGTKDATLTHFVPRQPATPDVLLMRVRDTINHP
jgi:hypothetical protein